MEFCCCAQGRRRHEGVTGLGSCGLAQQILCNPPTSPMALFTARRVKLLWNQTKPALLPCKLQPTTAIVGPPLLFTWFEFFEKGGQMRMLILPKSLLRLSSARQKEIKYFHRSEKIFLRGFKPKHRWARRGLLYCLQPGCIITAIFRYRSNHNGELKLSLQFQINTRTCTHCM